MWIIQWIWYLNKKIEIVKLKTDKLEHFFENNSWNIPNVWSPLYNLGF